MRTTESELAILRLSMRRIAEATRNPDIVAAIPNDYSDRGWNALAARVCEWIDDKWSRGL